MASTSRASNREKCLRLQVEDWTESDGDESPPRETEPLLSESASQSSLSFGLYHVRL